MLAQGEMILTGFEVSVQDSAAFLDGNVCGLVKNCFSDPAWLAAFEAHAGLDMEPCHHVAQSRSGPAAFMPAYIEKQSMCGTLRDRLLGRFSKAPVFRRWGRENALVCASPWGFYSGIESNRDCPEDVYQAVIHQMAGTACQKKLGLTGFIFVPESRRRLRACLYENGYRKVPVCPTAILDLKWNDFDQYLASLAGAKIRNVIRRERKKFKSLSFQWYDGSCLETRFGGRPLHSVLTRLYNNTHYKHHGQPSLLSDSFLKQLWKTDHENLRLCIAAKEDTIMSFVILRVYNSVAHAFMIGRDYSINDDFFSYFNMACYEPVIKGIEEKWRAIHFRPGIYYAKLKRGCRLENLYLYVKGHNPAARGFLKACLPAAEKYYRRKYAMPALLNY
ncbi:MAG: GNAT family N-acetyltransferase [Desulfobacteraceae bacterium]|nr:GNAT family N-acetyltransferase [Desulfobacteraceae bacterium]